MALLEMLVQGATCKCSFGTTPDKLKVLTQKKYYLNDHQAKEKLAATTKDIGSTFEKNSFGSCSKQNNQPCVATITEWSEYYEKISYDPPKGYVLTEKSKATCPIGGKDCISVLKSGQIAEPSKENFQNSDSELLANINPIFSLKDEENDEEITNYYDFISVNTEEQEIKDWYLDSKTGKVFNTDKTSKVVRIINAIDWNFSKDQANRVEYLQNNSKILSIDNQTIQNELQAIHSETTNHELQIFIVIEPETAKITAVRGEPGTHGLTEINAYALKNSDNYIVKNTVNGNKYALLGQVHTHDLIHSSQNSNVIGGERTENTFGTSGLDKQSSKKYNIPIYSIDSWNFGTKAQASINRVTPDGVQNNNIGKTQGAKGDGKKTVNIGQEVLNYKLYEKVN